MAKKITLETLAKNINNLAKSVGALTNTVDNLAQIVKNEFDAVDRRFDAADKRFDNIATNIKELKQGQEDIILRLTNVAYRFELQELQVEMNILKKDIIRLKKKVGVN